MTRTEPGQVLDVAVVDGAAEPDERESLAELFRDLRCSRRGLADREAARRLLMYGPNELTRRAVRRWPAELGVQLTQPLALLLAVAALLAAFTGAGVLAGAIVVVIVLNAAFAFTQEMQAERAIEALAAYLPPKACVLRDGLWAEVDARTLVPGDVVRVAEGDRACADARILDGTVMMDLAPLTGESVPVARSAQAGDAAVPLTQAQNLLFSGTTCIAGVVEALVTRTGMHTEIGRIAALAERAGGPRSPLERQVRRVTWLIALVAVGAGVAFLPVGVLAGLGWGAAAAFAIGLIVANVPEGLLPTITLALAAGARDLARRGALVKRLSAVETLGSVQVICTDKTGTLTENRMHVTRLWIAGVDMAGDEATGSAAARLLLTTAAQCTTAGRPDEQHPEGIGDPTELAVLRIAEASGAGGPPSGDRTVFPFDPGLKRMSTVTDLVVATKGAPEAVLCCCTRVAGPDGKSRDLDDSARAELRTVVDIYAAAGLRVLAVARRTAAEPPSARADAERGLTLLGFLALTDPPRAGVAEAVAAAHAAGVRVHVITGDHGLTAAAIARQVGIGGAGLRIVAGDELEAMKERDLDALLATQTEIVFARASPEAKLRVCEALRATGQVVAMTGDGVNDAPALRHADIGVAMGASGTDVAREAATMILTDDNFATIVDAIRTGRQIFDNVRRFILYIFAHATPEVVPFVVFAASGGAVPLPLTVLQILAVDLGTETLPALALGREPGEPGVMERPPRSRHAGVIDRRLLVRAWLLLGAVSAVLVMAGLFAVLLSAGWSPGAETGPGSRLHHAYQQATTMTFAGIVACQLGTAFAARTDTASLRQVGFASNPLLLWGVLFELAFTAAVIYAPPLQHVFGTTSLTLAQLGLLTPFPFVVWGVDEVARARRRTADARRSPAHPKVRNMP